MHPRWGTGSDDLSAEADSWIVAYEGYVPDDEGTRETLCALGNGSFVTRGAAPEASADGVHYPGTYAAGVYNRLDSAVAGTTVTNESIVNLPNWLAFTFRIGDGEWFHPSTVELLEYRQELNLRRGVLTRFVRFRDAADRTTRVVQRRFVHMGDRHLAALETTIVPEDWSGDIVVRSTISGGIENAGVERYRTLAARHLTSSETSELSDDVVVLRAETSQSRIAVAIAARTQLVHDHARLRRRTVRMSDAIGHELTVDVDRGDPVTVEKVVALVTARDRALSEVSYEAGKWASRAGGFDELLERHALVWDHLWRRCHFELEGAEAIDHAVRVLRLHLFHVLQTASRHSADLDVGVPARGLHGEAYRGHVLWDELFVLGILNVRLPELTRELLLYRYRRLDEARSSARRSGFAGALYPWQSASDGEEANQQLHLNPRSGRWIPDPTVRQRHIDAAIAYNVWKYYEVSGDRQFLVAYGAEMLLEIARFWSSIAEYDHASDRYVIRGVMGPDEFHEGYPGAEDYGVDNNAYTNIMAAWCLTRALDTLDLLRAERRAELCDTLGLTAAELHRWNDVSRRLFVPFHDDGIISQFEGYEQLEELDWSVYRERYGDIQRLDRIIEAEGDSVDRYKASKQADVLMLFYLLSADELGDVFERLGYKWDPAWIPGNIDYYLARTSHGSTLSAVVHAWVLARAHRGDGLDWFRLALASDVADVQGGTTAEGVHLGAMAGTIDLVERCFTGLEFRGDVLWLSPSWPEALGAFEFDVRYRGQLLRLNVSADRVRVRTDPRHHAPVRVGCRGEEVELGPGETKEFSL